MPLARRLWRRGFYLSGATHLSSAASAFLVREGIYLIDQGRPAGGQNRLLARAAAPGDRLCVFDPARALYGCEEIEAGDNQLTLEGNEGWRPLIRLSPVTSRTLELRLSGLPEQTAALKARLYPDLGPGLDEITLAAVNGEYQGCFDLPEPSPTGHIQVWADETAAEEDPRREAGVAYNAWSKPRSRHDGASLVSPDGQMIFFTPAQTLAPLQPRY